ncbi:MAG: tRNA (adenosine(37)-N6)-dimethylallyltransferase MiaA [bacterium]|nr:tRNA (adenosine(37)-N6)-dimethylallyltransferase MiaA [bacterium]
MTNKKIVVIIGGPTASGKSQLALDIAFKRKGALINADSQQIYGQLPLLTAAPTETEKKQVPHFLYEGWPDLTHVCSASLWREKAIQAIHHCHSEGLLPCVVGGTGFYLQALVEGLSPIPNIPAHVREDVTQQHQDWGPEKFHARLCEVDPESGKRLHTGDTQRLIRAFEVALHTGISLSQWQKEPKIMPEKDLWDFYTIILRPDRAELHKRAEKRLKFMFKNGAIEEVKKILSRDLLPHHPLLKAVGVREITHHLEGETLEEALEKSGIQTRQYIKRQTTWFNHHLKNAQVLTNLYPGSDPCATLEMVFEGLRQRCLKDKKK